MIVMKDKINTIKALSFEEALKELEILVKRLEEGTLPLEEAIASYEYGHHLKKHCDEKLKAAQLKIEAIVVNSQGETTVQPFKDEALSS
jgi:exodeoxyribonuclease VII small subunit